MMNLGLDIDGTITSAPAFFAGLASDISARGGVIHIVSSRAQAGYADTVAELNDYGLVWDSIYLLPSMSESQSLCPHGSLNWYEKYLWQKVDYALKMGVELFVDDDPVVLRLFARFAADMAAIHPGNQAGIISKIDALMHK